MDLRAWKETETKATSFHSQLLAEDEFVVTDSLKTSSLNYQHTDEYEAEDGSPPKGSGTGPMPELVPEDDWVEELPRPIPISATRSNVQKDNMAEF